MLITTDSQTVGWVFPTLAGWHCKLHSKTGWKYSIKHMTLSLNLSHIPDPWANLRQKPAWSQVVLLPWWKKSHEPTYCHFCVAGHGFYKLGLLPSFFSCEWERMTRTSVFAGPLVLQHLISWRTVFAWILIARTAACWEMWTWNLD